MNPLDHERFAMMMKLTAWKPMASWTIKKIGCSEDIFFWGGKSRTQKWQILLHSFAKAQHKWQNLEKTVIFLFKEQMLAN